jgi:Uma2 family endonuclease
MQHAPAHFERPASFTWDDFVALAEDDPRELIDGELLELDVPTQTHEHIGALIIFFLVQWTRSGNAGRVLGSGYKVRITDKRGVMPDVQLYRRNNLPTGQDTGLVRGRPDLAVEIMSPSSRSFDRVKKLRWYAAIGVPEYWLVDPEAHTVERLVLQGKHYSIEDSLADDDVLEPPTFPGLRIPLAELWAPPEPDPEPPSTT